MLALSKDRATLLGRATEVEVLTGLLDDVDQRGAALVLCGDPGIGKSRLLSEALALAEERQMNVLAARGVQSEARLAFGGLQQLLRPVRSEANGLPAAHQAVLEAALGVGDDAKAGPANGRPPRPAATRPAGRSDLTPAFARDVLSFVEPPEPFRIALVVLDLLSDAATDSPAREGYPTIFSTVDLPQLRLQPLDPESATRLLGESGDHLTAGERSRILREAAGNPLALVELPSIAHRLDDDQLMPGLVPLALIRNRAPTAPRPPLAQGDRAPLHRR